MKKVLLVVLVLVILLVAVAPVSAEVVHHRIWICKNGQSQYVNDNAGARQITNGNAVFGKCQ